ncbi:hypothetical protein MKW92_028483, partial [Papaver armeniacum]
MELINDEDDYKLYWETMFLENEELELDSGVVSSGDYKTHCFGEKSRKKLNERLHALRTLVPKISKMDKASIIKDAIEYIQELHEQERALRSEITELEFRKLKKSKRMNLSETEKKKIDHAQEDSSGSQTSSIDSLEDFDVSEKTMAVTLTCDKKPDTVVRLCGVFESLKLKIITANICAVSGRLWKTVYVE